MNINLHIQPYKTGIGPVLWPLPCPYLSSDAPTSPCLYCFNSGFTPACLAPLHCWCWPPRSCLTCTLSQLRAALEKPKMQSLPASSSAQRNTCTVCARMLLFWTCYMHRLCTNATVKRTFKLFNRSSMVGKSHQLLTTSCFFVTTLGFSLVAQKNYKKNCKSYNTFFAPSMFAIFATSPTQILLSSKTILLSLSFSVPCCTDRNFTRQKCVDFLRCQDYRQIWRGTWQRLPLLPAISPTSPCLKLHSSLFVPAW